MALINGYHFWVRIISGPYSVRGSDGEWGPFNIFTVECLQNPRMAFGRSFRLGECVRLTVDQLASVVVPLSRVQASALNTALDNDEAFRMYEGTSFQPVSYEEVEAGYFALSACGVAVGLPPVPAPEVVEVLPVPAVVALALAGPASSPVLPDPAVASLPPKRWEKGFQPETWI